MYCSATCREATCSTFWATSTVSMFWCCSEKVGQEMPTICLVQKARKATQGRPSLHCEAILSLLSAPADRPVLNHCLQRKSSEMVGLVGDLIPSPSRPGGQRLAANMLSRISFYLRPFAPPQHFYFTSQPDALTFLSKSFLATDASIIHVFPLQR